MLLFNKIRVLLDPDAGDGEGGGTPPPTPAPGATTPFFKGVIGGQEVEFKTQDEFIKHANETTVARQKWENAQQALAGGDESKFKRMYQDAGATEEQADNLVGQRRSALKLINRDPAAEPAPAPTPTPAPSGAGSVQARHLDPALQGLLAKHDKGLSAAQRLVTRANLREAQTLLKEDAVTSKYWARMTPTQQQAFMDAATQPVASILTSGDEILEGVYLEKVRVEARRFATSVYGPPEALRRSGGGAPTLESDTGPDDDESELDKVDTKTFIPTTGPGGDNTALQTQLSAILHKQKRAEKTSARR